ncbi:MAG: flagellar motor protein MotB, partial [Pseudomonadota bacterium]
MSNDNVEIIVLKRVEGPAEKKKGGVWKIAHADFMTAMMAFFLIMWLVNATDEEIKKSIANYFNPLNLMAAPSDRRGVMDPTVDARPPDSGEEAGQTTGSRPLAADTPGDGQGLDGGGNVEQGNERTMASAGVLSETDGPEFNDPYAELASEASDIDPDVPTAVDVPQTTIGAIGTTTQSDDARDPFDPAYWQASRRRDDRSLRPGNPETLPEIDSRAVIDAADAAPTGVAQEPRDPTDRTSGGSSEVATAPTPDDERLSAPGPSSAVAEAVFAALAPRENVNQPASSDGDVEGQPAPNSVASEIEELLAGTGAQISVGEVDGGDAPILISLTDEDARISMFPIGSAAPNPAAV